MGKFDVRFSPAITMGVYVEYIQYVDIHGIDGDYAITYLWTYYLLLKNMTESNGLKS